jgi:hypothetical protein
MEYEAKIAAKTLAFEDFRRKHIEVELNKFDRVVKLKHEVLKWEWSPLYNCNPSPWDHIEEEWSCMSSILLLNISLDAWALDKECPHIMRVIMYLIRTLERRNRPSNHKFKS